MRISFIDDNIIIFLNNNYNIELEDNERIKEYFKNILLNIKEMIDIDLSGLYLTRIYRDKNYGVVIELERDELDYYDYYIDEIDMHILISDVTFLYKIDDIFILDEILKKCDIIYFEKNYYLKLKEKLDNNIKILEFSEVIYKNTENIIKLGKKIVF